MIRWKNTVSARNENKGTVNSEIRNNLDIIGFGDDGSGYGIQSSERIHIAIFGEAVQERVKQ